MITPCVCWEDIDTFNFVQKPIEDYENISVSTVTNTSKLAKKARITKIFRLKDRKDTKDCGAMTKIPKRSKHKGTKVYKDCYDIKDFRVLINHRITMKLRHGGL